MLQCKITTAFYSDKCFWMLANGEWWFTIWIKAENFFYRKPFGNNISTILLGIMIYWNSKSSYLFVEEFIRKFLWAILIPQAPYFCRFKVRGESRALQDHTSLDIPELGVGQMVLFHAWPSVITSWSRISNINFSVLWGSNLLVNHAVMGQTHTAVPHTAVPHTAVPHSKW
jgi:hypothetical protein